MNVEKLIRQLNADFFTGVPDSLLKPLCDYLIATYGLDPQHHIVAANEGNSVAIAAGYHLATGKVPVVYLQNSGIGNIINPIASLTNEKVYAIPMIFLIGWRGEPGVKDEPQHLFQGEVTEQLIRDMEIAYSVISCETTESELSDAVAQFRRELSKGKDVAFLIKKGALKSQDPYKYLGLRGMKREEIIKHITAVAGKDVVISTTGKASRELYEIREQRGEGHRFDFLTVGSMGHSSSIALGVAMQTPYQKVWCIDGDGAALMHMGALAVIGAVKPSNMIHVIINNGAHESVGGMPTVARKIRLSEVAKSCGYSHVFLVQTPAELDNALCSSKQLEGPNFIEVEACLGARENLGRPKTSTIENKREIMQTLDSCS